MTQNYLLEFYEIKFGNYMIKMHLFNNDYESNSFQSEPITIGEVFFDINCYHIFVNVYESIEIPCTKNYNYFTEDDENLYMDKEINVEYLYNAHKVNKQILQETLNDIFTNFEKKVLRYNEDNFESEQIDINLFTSSHKFTKKHFESLKKKCKEYVIKCINNFGLEEHFENNITYYSKDFKDNYRFCHVEDMSGKIIQTMINRFEFIKEESLYGT